MRSRSAVGTPGPASCTVTLPPSTATSTGPSALNFTALSTRLRTALVSASGRPSTGTPRSTRTVMSRPLRRRALAATGSTTSARSINWSCSSACTSTARSTSSATKSVSSPSSASTSSSTAARSSDGSSSDRRSRSTLVRRLVSGVRSSWLASITRRRCWRRLVASAPSMVRKLPASLPTSPDPEPSTGWSMSPVSAMCSAVSARFTIGRTARPARNHAPAAAAATASDPNSKTCRRRSSTAFSTSSSGRATCTKTPSAARTVMSRRLIPCALMVSITGPRRRARSRRSKSGAVPMSSPRATMTWPRITPSAPGSRSVTTTRA